MYEQPYNPYQNNVLVIKDYFRSRDVLILAILSFASILMTVVNNIVSADLSKEIFAGFVSYYDSNIMTGSGNALTDISKGLHEALKNYDAVKWSYTVPIIPILTAVAILLVYLKSRDTRPDAAPSAGLTILYVLAIFALIGAVFAVLGMLALIAGMFLLYAEMTKSTKLDFTIRFPSSSPVRFDSKFMLILAIVTTVVLVIVIFFLLFVTISHVRYIGSVRKSMNSIELSRKGAKPYGVICVLAAASTIMGLISSFINLFGGTNNAMKELGIIITTDTTLPAIMALLTTAISAATLIFEAKIALGYARYIDNKKFGYSEQSAPEMFTPVNVGVGTSANHPNPYSYLAHPKTTENNDPAFVNPYLDSEKTVAAPQERHCPNCGAKADGNAPFCGQCGTKLP